MFLLRKPPPLNAWTLWRACMSCINRVYFWTLCKASMPSDQTFDPPDRTTMAKGWLTKLSYTTESYCASFFGLSTFKIGFRPFQRLSTITARRACHPICPMSRWAESPWRKDLLTQFSCTLNTQNHIVPSLSWDFVQNQGLPGSWG